MAPSSRTSTAPAAETARSTDAETPVQPVGGTGVPCCAAAATARRPDCQGTDENSCIWTYTVCIAWSVSEAVGEVVGP